MNDSNSFGNRRRFLRTSGVALALPWLTSTAVRGGIGNDPEPPKRFFAICQDLGFLPKHFFPATGETSNTASSYLKILHPHREHFTVFSGLSHPAVGGGHRSSACFLTAQPGPERGTFRNSISLDQYIASKLPQRTRFPTINLTVNGQNKLSYSADGSAIPEISTPADAFRAMFLQGKPAEVQRQIKRLRNRQSILDGLTEDLKSLSNEISANDAVRLQQFESAVRDVEVRLVRQREWEKIPKPKVDAKVPPPLPSPRDYVQRLRLMYDVTRLAFQTDSTRVATLMVGSTLTPGLTFADGVEFGGYHGISHHGQDKQKLKQLEQIERRQMRLLAQMLTRFRETPDGHGCLLDHTSILYGSNLGDANRHDTRDLPILIAGGGHQHGRHQALGTDSNVPLCNLYVSLLQDLGIETDRFASSTGTLNL